MASSSSSSSSSNTVQSYIGSFISLISNYDIRYEGVLYHLSVQDSTIGLKNVRSYGTEGRKKDGPQIPPNNKLFEFILFRGTDIKDLQVKATPPPQMEEHIHNDPAIIQSHYAGAPLSSSPSASIGGTLSIDSAKAQNKPALGQGFNGAPIGWSHTPQQGNPFQPQSAVSSSLLVRNQMQTPGPTDSPIMGLTNALEHVSHVPSVATNPSHSMFLPPLAPVQYSTSPDMPSSSSIKTSPPSQAAYITANRLTTPSMPLFSQGIRTIDAQNCSKTLSNPITVTPVLSMPYAATSYVDATSSTLLTPLPSMLSTNHLAQSRSHELPSMQHMYIDQKDMGAPAVLSSTSSSLISSLASQAPLLPLPTSVSQHHYMTTQFTEEFDFEAMNEKFKKEEVWGFLGKAKQRDKRDDEEDNATDQSLGQNGTPVLAPDFEPKPAYKKDEFFDTISCNSLAQGRNGQSRLTERKKLNTETFGRFHQSPNLGYGGYGAGFSYNHNGSHNWGRGYGYSGRGRGSGPF